MIVPEARIRSLLLGECRLLSLSLLLAFFVTLLSLQGCNTSVQVSGSIPSPMVARLPLKVGVYFSEDFKSFKHEEVIKQQGSWEIELGKHNLLVFGSLFNSLFQEVREVGEPPITEIESAGLDGVIVPEITKYGFLAPSISGLKFFSASIHYRIIFYDRKGKRVGEWVTVGYGKAETSGFGQGESLEAATLDAIRDGGAQIAIKMVKHPTFIAWSGTSIRADR